VTAQIPFSFEMSSAVLTPGNYTISIESRNGTVLVESFETKSGAVAVTTPVKFQSENHPIKLVFTCYGKRAFLSRIDFLGSVRALPPTEQERELVTSTITAGLRPTVFEVAAYVR
jgi:hypothetical protein